MSLDVAQRISKVMPAAEGGDPALLESLDALAAFPKVVWGNRRTNRYCGPARSKGGQGSGLLAKDRPARGAANLPTNAGSPYLCGVSPGFSPGAAFNQSTIPCCRGVAMISKIPSRIMAA